ncbi:TolC family protein [Bacteroides coprosuis]|uniref:TolC family protein n=1 Tax=Bacteroides coprosuis TaxID=151276 RepID=UPI001E138A5B|nr:TolC family protein [Bacteroides coprosuis]HJD92587.1 TolC family protein [Bacteroides coprosuis]
MILSKQNIIIAAFLFLFTATFAQEPISWNLKECIDYAIENNLTIKQADNAIEENKLTKETNKWARLPNLNGNVSQGWNWGRSASPVDNSYTDIKTSNANFGLSTSVPLFTGLEIPNQYALAKLNLKAAIADLKKAKEDLSINVTSKYIQVLFNQEITKVAENQITLSQEQLDRGTEQYNLGKLSKAELAELKSRLKQDEMQFVEAQNNYKIALLDLTQLLELPSPDFFGIQPLDGDLGFDNLTAPTEIYESALLFKPQIEAAQLRSESAKRSIKLAQSGFMPKLSFSANIGSGYFTIQGQDSEAFRRQLSNNLNKYVGFSLSVPIFNRFATRNQVRAAKLSLNNQLIQLEDQKKTLYKEIQQAWYSATAAEAKFQASKSAQEANNESFTLMKEKYEVGKANNIEFNEAKINLMKAESDLIQAKYEYLFRTKILNFYKGEPIE